MAVSSVVPGNGTMIHGADGKLLDAPLETYQFPV